MSAEAGVFLFLLLIWMVVSACVAFHASENGRNPILWAIVVFLLGIWGLIVYGLILVFGAEPR